MARPAAQEALASSADIAQHVLAFMNDASCTFTCKIWEEILFGHGIASESIGTRNCEVGMGHCLRKLCPHETLHVMVKAAWSRLAHATKGLLHMSATGA